MENNRRDVGLLCTTDFRFAGYFYSIRLYLWCSQPLKATVHEVPWAELNNKKAIVFRTVANINSDLYLRQSYVVLCTVFPEILAM